jgi:hypothetical protein
MLCSKQSCAQPPSSLVSMLLALDTVSPPCHSLTAQPACLNGDADVMSIPALSACLPASSTVHEVLCMAVEGSHRVA